MLSRMIFTILALTALTSGPAGASAQERFALVLGNSSYSAAPALPNPVRDAKAVGDFLRSAGFDVTAALDLNQSDMRDAVRDFVAKLADKSDDSVALVYFAGHGVQIDGQNYLLPVDAEIAREADVALAGVGLADVMNLLDTVPSKTRIVILDACRNNPFDAINSGTGRGLAIVNAPAGTVVAYSTSPGATAEDGSGDNSPFATALIETGSQPGMPIATVFQTIRLAVHKQTQGRQTPWEVTALTEDFAFFPGAQSAAAAPAPDKTDAVWERELRSYSPRGAYDVVILQDNVVVYQIFLAIHADSTWGRRIRGLMERRLEMVAWFDAISRNSAEAFAAFLRRYPNSDLAPTAERLGERARQRSLFASNSPGALDIEPEVRTVTKEVRVPFEVVKEVKVPVEVIREVKVPVERVVVKEVKVPVERIVTKVVQVPSPPIIKTVRVPCDCGGSSSTTRPHGSGSSGPTINVNPQLLNTLKNLRR